MSPCPGCGYLGHLSCRREGDRDRCIMCGRDRGPCTPAENGGPCPLCGSEGRPPAPLAWAEPSNWLGREDTPPGFNSVHINALPLSHEDTSLIFDALDRWRNELPEKERTGRRLDLLMDRLTGAAQFAPQRGEL